MSEIREGPVVYLSSEGSGFRMLDAFDVVVEVTACRISLNLSVL